MDTLFQNLNPLDDRLKKRYGQARFDPSQGQNQMTFQEWLDRHPALQSNADSQAKYEAATGAEGGAAYQAKNAAWQDTPSIVPTKFTSGTEIDNEGQEIKPPNVGGMSEMGPPDPPPASAVGGNPTRRQAAGNYAAFVKKNGGKSTALLGAQFTQQRGGKLNPKMQAALKKNGTTATSGFAK